MGILNDFLCKDVGVGQSKRLPVGHRKSGVTMGTNLSPTKLTTRLGSITENQSNCQSKTCPFSFSASEIGIVSPNSFIVLSLIKIRVRAFCLLG